MTDLQHLLLDFEEWKSRHESAAMRAETLALRLATLQHAVAMLDADLDAVRGRQHALAGKVVELQERLLEAIEGPPPQAEASVSPLPTEAHR